MRALWRGFACLCLVAGAVAGCSGSGQVPGAIPQTAIGMHWMQYTRSAMSKMHFGAVRWNGGDVVTWPDLQPTPTTALNGDNPAVRRLDKMVHFYEDRGVEPLIVLGGTPAWDASDCAHGTWPVETCGPKEVGPSSPWSKYVDFLAGRYRHVSFEIWNEPNLKNGYNDDIGKLAEMQQTASAIIHRHDPHTLVVSPSLAVTAGDPFGWIRTFLQQPGGRDFDVLGLHLYSSDASARAGSGPEWSIAQYEQIRKILQDAGISRPVWDTEVNVGRYAFRSTTSRAFTGAEGAAMVARTYVLQLGSGIRRVYWYAADDQLWSGTWLLNPGEGTLTQAGVALNVVDRMLVGAAPRGCAADAGGVWRCYFALSAGKSMLVTWTTGSPTSVTLPGGVDRVEDALGHVDSGRPRTLRLTASPLYLVGSSLIPKAATSPP